MRDNGTSFPLHITPEIQAYLDHLKAEKTNRAGKLHFTNSGLKVAVCPYCARAWETSRPGGGMVQQAANRHVKACPDNPNKGE